MASYTNENHTRGKHWKIREEEVDNDIDEWTAYKWIGLNLAKCTVKTKDEQVGRTLQPVSYEERERDDDELNCESHGSVADF